MLKLQPPSIDDILSLSEAELDSLRKSTSLPFALKGNAVVTTAEYDPANIEALRAFARETVAEMEIRHSIWLQYEEKDYKEAQFWILRFPDLWVENAIVERKCRGCSRTISLNDDLSQLEIPFNECRPAVAINGRMLAFHQEMVEGLSKEFPCFRHSPIDDAGRYFRITPRCRLEPLIVLQSESIGLKAECELCRVPQFDMFFGPLRYPATAWDGAEIVFGVFHDGILFAPRAAEWLSENANIGTRDGVAFIG